MASFEEGRVIGSAAFWGAILNIGGVLLITGSLGYAALTLQAYEDRCGSVETCEPAGAGLETIDVSPTENAVTPSTTLPEQNAAAPAAAPAPPDPVLTEKIDQLTKDLEDARGKLAESEATNANLQSRIAELQQQASAPSSDAEQCRGELVDVRNRARTAIEQLQRNVRELNVQLRECQNRVM
jgi:predicted RNase H-like nuclease (RuvC/YqgF family)